MVGLKTVNADDQTILYQIVDRKDFEDIKIAQNISDTIK